MRMLNFTPGIPTDPDDIATEEGGVISSLVRLAYIEDWTLSRLNSALAHVFDGDLAPMSQADVAAIGYAEFGVRKMLGPGVDPDAPAAEAAALTPAEG